MSPYSSSGRSVGDKLAPKLIPLIRDAVIATKLGLLDTDVKVRHLAHRKTANWAGHEVADLYAPLINAALDGNPDMHEHAQGYLRKIASGDQQWQAIVGGMALGGVGSAIGSILNNAVANGVYIANRVNPQLTLDPATFAALVARGLWEHADADYWVRGQGVKSTDFDGLVALAHQIPDIQSLGQLLNRGLADGEIVQSWATRNGYPANAIGPLLALRHVLLSPADLADMVVRGIKTEDEAAKEAAKSGVDAIDFAALVLDTGEPPSLTDLLEAKRRGYIDDTRLVHGIRQSRVRNEWVDVIEALSLSPMSTADAITASIQGHLTDAQARAIAAQNGLIPSQYDPLQLSAGEPLSSVERIKA